MYKTEFAKHKKFSCKKRAENVKKEHQKIPKSFLLRPDMTSETNYHRQNI